MASRLDRILMGPPRANADAPQTGAPKEGPSGSLEGQQREPSPHRSRVDTPPAPAQSRSVPRPQPPHAPKADGQAKPQATGPLTRGRAAASSKGETSLRSVSPDACQVGDAAPRPAPVREGPGALTRGGSRPVGRGTGRRAILPVGLKRTLEQAQPSMAKRLKVGAASKDSGSSDPRPPTGAESAPPRPLEKLLKAYKELLALEEEKKEREAALSEAQEASRKAVKEATLLRERAMMVEGVTSKAREEALSYKNAVANLDKEKGLLQTELASARETFQRMKVGCVNGEIARSAAEEAKKKALQDLEAEQARSRSLSNDIDRLKRAL
ncbi:uncharacterized protein LOC110432734 [Sorghum bicolor]|uniref:uncharacterized protein LOC110432734 n=1 Tax=Sorghum bicolor TaxID=4558 RepID=UPI000B425DED|nr:uncharacterized protein LOC110432734 [Sorghum bicolor]|eukprot:XP_021309201.1 uncharacterized protein LOC110432734 [Sorghum bicolor]